MFVPSAAVLRSPYTHQQELQVFCFFLRNSATRFTMQIIMLLLSCRKIRFVWEALG